MKWKLSSLICLCLSLLEAELQVWECHQLRVVAHRPSSPRSNIGGVSQLRHRSAAKSRLRTLCHQLGILPNHLPEWQGRASSNKIQLKPTWPICLQWRVVWSCFDAVVATHPGRYRHGRHQGPARRRGGREAGHFSLRRESTPPPCHRFCRPSTRRDRGGHKANAKNQMQRP